MNNYESYIDLVLNKEEQRRVLVEMMEYDENLGLYDKEKIKEDIMEIISEYDNNCSNWFEDESFIVKKVPVFNFV